jgi:hypothetical protein
LIQEKRWAGAWESICESFCNSRTREFGGDFHINGDNSLSDSKWVKSSWILSNLGISGGDSESPFDMSESPDSILWKLSNHDLQFAKHYWKHFIQFIVMTLNDCFPEYDDTDKFRSLATRRYPILIGWSMSSNSTQDPPYLFLFRISFSLFSLSETHLESPSALAKRSAVCCICRAIVQGWIPVFRPLTGFTRRSTSHISGNSLQTLSQ